MCKGAAIGPRSRLHAAAGPGCGRLISATADRQEPLSQCSLQLRLRLLSSKGNSKVVSATLVFRPLRPSSEVPPYHHRYHPLTYTPLR
jgi:hypothetical protein